MNIHSLIRRLASTPSQMRAVIAKDGKPFVTTMATPTLAAGERLLKVEAAALNRADVLQVQGKYPPPPRTTSVLGLEATGRLEDGSRVCALLSGGAFAEYVAVPESAILRFPSSSVMNLPTTSLAAIPEGFLVAYHLLFELGQLTAGKSVLVHAAASGIGTSVIQLALKVPGVRIIASAGSSSKLDACKTLGAHNVINYKIESLSERVLTFTEGHGVDLILDCVGATMFKENLRSSSVDARWVLYGLLSGAKSPDINLAGLLAKRIQLLCTALRARSPVYKANLISKFIADYGLLVGTGQLDPVVDKVFDGLESVESAMDYMLTNANVGKIVVRI